MTPFRLIAIADLDRWSKPDARDRAVAAALRGGITTLQLRGKRATPRELFDAACVLAPVTREAGVLLVVNDRPDVAVAAGADGAHLGPEDLPPAAARRVLGPGGCLGVSARDPERIRLAEAADAAYLGVGALRSTSTKPDARVIGVGGIVDLTHHTHRPIVAIGGVSVEDIAALKRGGVTGIAVSSGIFGGADPEGAARAYRSTWDAE